MKRMVILLFAFVGSIAQAHTASFESQAIAYQLEVCNVYAQVESQLQPFMLIEEIVYEKSFDGGFQETSRMVPNLGLAQGVSALDQICSQSRPGSSISQLVQALNQIRNNIWDSSLQNQLQTTLNRGFDIWTRGL